MNREIIFRGKRIDNGEWVEGALYDGYSQTRALIILNIDGFNITEAYEVDRETVGQFTGLLDIDGTEIFEGDIIQHTTVNFRHTYTVAWCDDYASVQLRGNGRTRYFGVGVESDKCEVIGNIYERR